MYEYKKHEKDLRLSSSVVFTIRDDTLAVEVAMIKRNKFDGTRTQTDTKFSLSLATKLICFVVLLFVGCFAGYTE